MEKEMHSKILFLTVAMVLASLAMTADASNSKKSRIEDIAARAAVAYIQKHFGLKIKEG